MITLSKADMANLLKEAKTELVERLLTEKRAELELLTEAQVCGILNVSAPTLKSLTAIPRVLLTPTLFRYKASDVAGFIQERREA